MNTGANIDGIYGLFLGQTVPQRLKVDDKNYIVLFRKKRTYLPFELELIDFKKVMHAGTDIAKSFSSKINLIEEDISRQVLIQMNEPLRHKGYTFYQASFIESEDKQTSVLAVVKNYGRLFPYISSVIMCIGILIHMIMMIRKRF